MSLLKGLCEHDKNPSEHWGKFLSTSVHKKSPESSEDSPENDEVCLVSLSSTSTRSQRSSLTNDRRRSRCIEIEDGPGKVPQSSMDKQPKDYLKESANFVIPKLKSDSGISSSSNIRPTKNCLNTKSNGIFPHDRTREEQCSSVEPNTRTRNTRTSEKTLPISINRSWNHAERPRFKGSSRIASTTIYEEVTADNDLKECNRTLETSPTNIHCQKSSRMHMTLPSTSNKILETDDDSCMETTKSSSKPADVSKDLIFCSICGGPLSHSCCVKCQRPPVLIAHITTDSFYSSKNHLNKYNIKYSGKPETRKFSVKRKSSIRHHTESSKNQTKLNNSENGGLTTNRTRQNKNSRTSQELELVHISSDEDDKDVKEAVVSDVEKSVEETSNEEFCENGFEDETINEATQVHEDRKEMQDGSEEKYSIPEDDDILSMGADTTDTVMPVEIKKKLKINSTKKIEVDNFYERDSIVTYLLVQYIYVGKLQGFPVEPVKVTAERISISLTNGTTDYHFKIGGRDLVSFKINNNSYPFVVIIEPTPGCARKMNEKYQKIKMFIDPGSAVYEEKFIVLLLSEKLEKENVSDLMELVKERLSESNSVWKPISPQSASTSIGKLPARSKKAAKNRPDRAVDQISTTASPPSMSVSSPSISVSSKPSTSLSSKPSTSLSSKPSTSLSSKSSTSLSSLSLRKSYNTRSKDIARIDDPKRPPEKLLVYPASGKQGAITITTKDVECLLPDTYLNDVIIDFFIKYLFEEVLNANDRGRTHIFSSFFYKRLTQKNCRTGADKEMRSPQRMHSSVKTWTKNVDIFTKDFLIFPINESSHWYLAVICYPGLVAEQPDGSGSDDQEKQSGEDVWASLTNSQGICEILVKKDSEEIQEKNGEESETQDDIKMSVDDDDEEEVFNEPIRKKNKRMKVMKKSTGKAPSLSRPCILIFDSLGGSHRAMVLINVRNYLTCEWKERRASTKSLVFTKENLRGCYPKVPGQQNFSDCGIYVLQYVQSFFQDPITDYSSPINIPDWFSLDVIQKKREKVRALIYKLKDRVHIDDSS